MRLPVAFGCGLLVSFGAIGSQAAPEQTPQPASRGQALFLGQAPLEGKIRGHVDPLPPAVVRCVNCHGEGKRKLDAPYLLEMRQRRGGPPSAYNQASFCKLLRTGIDPAYVMIAHEMPVYDLPASDCEAIWVSITKRKATDGGH